MSKVFSITEGLENMGAMRTGGQGSVYKGRRMGPVISAVKILPTPIHTEDEGDKNFRHFQNEVEKLRKVNEEANPNVVKILNSGLTESGSFPFIEMEFIEGPDLEEMLKPPNEKIFTLRETIKLADHLANALAHCHERGVMHGDIKSNNVKYNIHSGNYVLLDFGLAVMSDEQRRTSMRHAGAIEFMAPEQNNGTMLFQTDIYSYGIVLFELLAGQVPFPLKDSGETSRNAVMIAHMETPLPDLMELRKQNMPDGWHPETKEQEALLPIWLEQLVNKCLEKDPAKRYKDGAALQAALVTESLGGNSSVAILKKIESLSETVKTLTAQLEIYKQNEQHAKKYVLVRKHTFAATMLLFICLVAFGSYGIFKAKTNLSPNKTDTPTHKASSSYNGLPIAAIPGHEPDTSKQQLQLKAKKTADSLKKVAAAKAARKRLRRKKKKFLGIF